MRWWLLQSLQQGIGSCFSKHVDFIYDVYLVAGDAGTITHPFPEIANLVNATVAGSIYLHYVQRASFGNGAANITIVAWFAPLLTETINCLGQDTPGTRFASASRAAKKISMGYFLALHSAAQSPRYRLLPYYFSKTLRPPLAIENFKPHVISLIILPAIKFLKGFWLLSARGLVTMGNKKVQLT
jgi:hypothetical protein